MANLEPGVPQQTGPAPTETIRQLGDDKGISQGRLVFKRFVGHKPAMISLVLLVLVIGFAMSASGAFGIQGWWKWSYEELLPPVEQGRPTLQLWPFSFGDHPFGQDTVGKDYFAMVMRGVVNSMVVMFILGAVATFIGVVVGAVAGYYRGWVDAVLMRITDIVIIIPIIVIGAVVGSAMGARGPVVLALFLGFFAWTGMARLVRAEFLSLREREFVEAARVAGASDARIIFKHILPNAMGIVIVSATLAIAAAILLETSLSFLGYGIQAPDVSLGSLISRNESAFQTRPWLFWWPAVFIVLLSLLVNFVGDGLRDAFDPRQKNVVFRRVKELPQDENVMVTTATVEDVPGGPNVADSPDEVERREGR